MAANRPDTRLWQCCFSLVWRKSATKSLLSTVQNSRAEVPDTKFNLVSGRSVTLDSLLFQGAVRVLSCILHVGPYGGRGRAFCVHR